MGKVGRRCTICECKDRHLIEVGLVSGVSHETLAARFGVGHDAVRRHARRHLTAAQAAAILVAQKPSAIDLETLRTNESEGMLGTLVVQRARLQQCIDRAFEAGDTHSVVAAERVVIANLELVGKLLGTIITRTEVTHGVLVSSDYLRLRETIIRTLRDHPDAARAVGQALAELETEAAKEIGASKSKPLLIEATPQPVPSC
jgi:hypothetical protein